MPKRNNTIMAMEDLDTPRHWTSQPPKVELHIHLEGAVRPSTVWDLAKKSGVDVPGNNAEELARLIRNFNRENFSSFIQALNTFLPVLIADKDAIKRVAYELCEDKAKEGVVYLEVRFSPFLLANCGITWLGRSGDVEKKLPIRIVMQSVIEGIEAGQRDFNIKTRLILVMTKEEPGSAAECLQMAKEFSNAVVAIDLVGDENLPLDPEIVGVYSQTPTECKQKTDEAERCGIHRTVHAGKTGPASHVKEAIEVLYAERIGHGYHCLDDEKVYQMVKDKKIHIEACVTSSVFTGACDPDFTKHPCVRFLKDNVNFSLNTDDPLMFGNTVNEEFKIAEEYFGLSDEQAAQLTLNAARSSFLPDGEKQELIQQIETAHKQLAGLKLTV